MFAVADQRRFAPWLAASALVHALGAAFLLALRPLPSAPPEPLRVVRVDLVGASAAPPVAAPPAAESPAPPPPAPAPAPKPQPAVRSRPAETAPAPIAAEAPALEPASPAEPAADGAGAAVEGAATALAAVGSGPPGAGTGSGNGSGGADALAAYIAGLQRAIDAHKSYPPLARRRGIEGVVTVRLAIDAAGTLERTALVGSSPALLARSTREAVDRAGPFLPPPGGPLQIEFPVRYEIVD